MHRHTGTDLIQHSSLLDVSNSFLSLESINREDWKSYSVGFGFGVLGQVERGQRGERGLSWWWFGSGSGRSSSGASTLELSLSRLAASLCSLRSSAVALRVWSFFLLVLLAGSLVGHLVRVSNSITTTTTISREKGRYISWFRQNGTESVERGTPRVQCSIVSAHGCGSM